jgi:hypothetical protein
MLGMRLHGCLGDPGELINKEKNGIRKSWADD